MLTLHPAPVNGTVLPPEPFPGPTQKNPRRVRGREMWLKKKEFVVPSFLSVFYPQPETL
jgi:hypothetical protein